MENCDFGLNNKSGCYAFVISADAFWGASDQIDYGTNTMGEAHKKTNKIVKWLRSLL